MNNESVNLMELLDVMARLRNLESGCPWDLKQTFETLVSSTLEECYELAAAIDDGDFDHIHEELGDVLFQVIFYAQLAKEAGKFDFNDNFLKKFSQLIISVSFIYLFGVFWLGTLIGWERPLFQLGVQPFILAELFKILIILFSLPKLKKLSQYLK